MPSYPEFDEYEYLERQVGPAAGTKHPHSHSPSRPRSSRRRSRSPSLSRERRSHRRSRSPKRRRERSPRDALAREHDREYKELERATRTIFVSNLNLKADERDIFEFFSAAGKVTDIRLITDRHTKRSKGLAYVEFAKQDEVLAGLALHGQKLLGQTLQVKSAEAEKNLAWEAQQLAKASLGAAAGASLCTLQVLNLHPELSEAELRPLFDSFGALESLQVMRDATGKSLKYARVAYKVPEDAQRAQQYWNNRVAAGLRLSVTFAPANPAQDAVVAPGELDEDEGSGVKLTSQARSHLMNRLASSHGVQAAQPGTPPGQVGGRALPAGDAASALLLDQGLLGPASPIPTQCLLLKNMFDPDELADPQTEQEITQDVLDECGKFGRVLHHFLDKSSKGFVYLKFDKMEAAQAASRTLHGRWYSGHQIMADYQFTQVYNRHFKL